MANFNTPNALDWLNQNQKSAQLIDTARSLIAAEKLIKNLVPKALAKHVRVSQINGQSLSLIVPGPAHAARLKQISDTLASQLNLNGWNINRIIVRIDAHRELVETKPPYKKTNTLSQEALVEFIALEKNVAPGPLAEAIKRLIDRHSES